MVPMRKINSKSYYMMVFFFVFLFFENVKMLKVFCNVFMVINIHLKSDFYSIK